LNAEITIKSHILKLKCTESNFGWGSAPVPAGERTVLCSTLAGFKGPTSNGRGGAREEGKGREGKREREGAGRWKGGERGILQHFSVTLTAGYSDVVVIQCHVCLSVID